MIYCFEVTKLDSAGRPPEDTMQYFERCLQALKNQSPKAPVFILIQKMDLVNPSRRQADFDIWVNHVKVAAGETPFSAFGTSIHEDTLYRVRDNPFFYLACSSLKTFLGMVGHYPNSRSKCSKAHQKSQRSFTGLWCFRDCDL